MVKLLLSIVGLALTTSVNAIHADLKYWCGKKYNATDPSFDGYNIGWSDVQRDLPRGVWDQKIRVVQGIVPYLETDTDTTLVVYIPKHVFQAGQEMNITVTVPELNAQVVVGPADAEVAVSFPADISNVPIGNSIIAADFSFADYQLSVDTQRYFDTVYFPFYKVAPPAGGSVVGLQTETQGLSINGSQPFIPVGYYVDPGSVLTNYSQAEAQFKQYKSEGYNVLMYTGPLDDDEQMQWTLDLAEEYGLYFQADVTDLTGDVDTLVTFISNYSTHPNFLSYYIGNEPDGDQGIGSLEPTQSLRAYEILKMEDPYHPVTIVSNCEHTAPDYATHVDFYMVDVYAVGIPDMYNGFVCNTTQGCCGCDNCDINSPVKSIADRYEAVRTDLGVFYPPTMFVEQTFYDTTSYWSRNPTYQEELSMAWISIVSGGSGVLGYTWPVYNSPGVEPPLSQALSDFAHAFLAEGLSTKTTLSGNRLAFGSSQGVYYAVWSTGTIIAVNTNYSDAALSIDISEFGFQGKSISSQSQGFGGRPGSVPVTGGIFIDEFTSLEVKVYSF